MQIITIEISVLFCHVGMSSSNEFCLFINDARHSKLVAETKHATNLDMFPAFVKAKSISSLTNSLLSYITHQNMRRWNFTIAMRVSTKSWAIFWQPGGQQ